MAEAIFGLVGVMVGALVTSLGEWVLERRREKGDVRRAARLVHMELLEIYAILSTASIGEEEFPAEKGERLPVEAWDAGRNRLAGSLGEEEWSKVVVAYRSVAMLNEIAARRDRPLKRHQPISSRDWLRESAADVRLALDAVADVAEFEDPEEVEVDALIEKEARDISVDRRPG